MSQCCFSVEMNPTVHIVSLLNGNICMTFFYFTTYHSIIQLTKLPNKDFYYTQTDYVESACTMVEDQYFSLVLRNHRRK